MSHFQSAFQRTRHILPTEDLASIEAVLLSAGYDLSDSHFLGEGYEGLAIYVELRGNPRALRVVAPLSHYWEPDWGKEPYHCRLFAVDGVEVRELPAGRHFWFVQEYGEKIDRAEEVEPELWEELEAALACSAGGLFEDIHTHVLEQVCLVEREDGQHILYHDYGAFSSVPI